MQQRQGFYSVLLVPILYLSLVPFTGALGAAEVVTPWHEISFPTSSVNTLGFTARIDVGVRLGAGSVPTSVTITSNSKFASDERFVLRFEPFERGQSPPTNGLRVDIPMTVAQGTKSKTFSHAMPKFSVGSGYRVTLMQDGVPLDDCITEIGDSYRSIRNSLPTHWLINEYRLNWLFVSESDVPSETEISRLRSINTAILRSEIQTSRANNSGFSAAWHALSGSGVELDGFPMHVIGNKVLPTDWRQYQDYDLVVVPHKTYLDMESGEDWKGLNDWILCGGSLLVLNCPSEEAWIRAGKLSSTDPIYLKRQLELAIAEIDFENVAQRQVVTQESKQTPSKKTEKSLTPRVLRRTLWIRSKGAGLVFGVAKNVGVDWDEEASESAEFYPVPSKRHLQAISYIIGHRMSPMLRRGVDPILGDGRFRRWLIPGVAQPPVYTFMGLLTVFVVLVGPVAYRSTAKRGRTYLMFLIAPVLAVFTTISMFAYGIVSDGFGTSIRVRQLTWVDSRSQSAGERTQSTYFAGLRPAEGLRFDSSAEVVRYPDGNGGAWEELQSSIPATLGVVSIGNDSQRWSSSFLPSREQRQFVEHRVRQNIGSVELSVNAEMGEASLSSSLDFDLHRVVVADSSGTHWTCASLSANQSDVRSIKLTKKESSKVLGRLYNDFRPLAEVSHSRSRLNYDGLTRDLIGVANSVMQSDKPQLSPITTGTFENWLNERLLLEGDLPAMHFVGLSDVTEDVVAVDQAEMIESVRYVFGTVK